MSIRILNTFPLLQSNPIPINRFNFLSISNSNLSKSRKISSKISSISLRKNHTKKEGNGNRLFGPGIPKNGHISKATDFIAKKLVQKFESNFSDSSYTTLRGRLPRKKSASELTWSQMYGGKVMERARDQKESVGMMYKLYYEGDESDLSTLFGEIKGNVVELCMNSCGNFVLAESLKRLSDEDRESLLEELMEDEENIETLIPNLSCVAPLVEFMSFSAQSFLPHVVNMAKSKGGSLVLAKLMKQKSPSIRKIAQELRGHAVELATHPYGNIVMGQLLRNYSSLADFLWRELVSYGLDLLIDDKYGAFVVSSMISRKPKELSDIIPKLMESRARSMILLKVFEEENLESARFLLPMIGANLLKFIESEFGWTIAQACVRTFPLEETRQFWSQIDSEEGFEAITRTEEGSYVLGEMVKKDIRPLSHRISQIAKTRGGAGALRHLILEEDPVIKEIIIEGLVGHVAELARDKYGCSVVKLFIKRLSEEERDFIWKEILDVKVFKTIWNEVSVGRWVIEEMRQRDQSIDVSQLLLKI
eukprot:TRINITY_DN4155_c0_g2_i1.p1 TRINITY_DN4155_c0_g2~~TRINITY_DN4155_c0_g2_i1.p1  ORF type:complete len:535 (+),score=189.76 TRINITY_DN4155_c0_g2_i1:138-1742(+)